MTSEFEFLEARLRRQLPELTDAYGAAPIQPGSEPSVPLLGDDEVPLLPVPDPVPEPASRRTSRFALITSAAVIVVVVGLLSTVFATRGNVSTTDPAGSPVAEGGEAEESALVVEVDDEPTDADASTTSALDDEVASGSSMIGEDSAEEETTATSQANSETTASSNDANPADDADAEPATDTNTATTLDGRGCVGNRVWEDLDGNGIQDRGEPGIVDTTISLFDPSGARVDTQKLVNGYFSLCGPVGNYRLSVLIPPGYSVTAADQGISDHKDSDADATGTIELTVDRARKRSKYDIGLVNTNSESASVDTSAKPVTSTSSAATPLVVDSQTRSTKPAIAATPVAVSKTKRSPTPANANTAVVAKVEPEPAPAVSSRTTNRGSNDVAWGFWVETRNAYADNGKQPLVDRGVETTFENYSFAHVKANSLHV